jgi:hypothetical protein
MAKVGTFINRVDSAAAVASVGTTYASAKRITLKMLTSSDARSVSGYFDQLYVYVSSISSAAALSMKITNDTDGDDVIVQEIPGRVIETGITTAAEGTVVFDLGHQAWSDTDDTVYAWIKCNNGTVTVDLARLIWSE